MDLLKGRLKAAGIAMLVLLVGIGMGRASMGNEAASLRTSLAQALDENASSQAQVVSMRANVIEMRQENGSLTDNLYSLESQLDRVQSRIEFMQSKRPLPSLAGMSVGRLKGLADKMDWKVVVAREVSSQPPGTIISQSPAVGATVHEGSTIHIVVAKAPPPPPKPAPPSSPDTTTDSGGGSGCTPGYSPCLPPAPDYDCAGGTGDGPKYTGTVMVTGSDPYGLDSDGDGVGCES